MTPKRKAVGFFEAITGWKKAKTSTSEEDDKPSTTQDVIAKLKDSESRSEDKKRKVDSFVPAAKTYEVFEDYDCLLNQTDIGHNNNKYYIIQILKKIGALSFYTWNRWGRVGEPGANAMKGPFGSAEPAIKDFTKKFQEKTQNKWVNRDSFSPVPGKYTLIEMSLEDEDDTQAASKPPVPTEKCTLDAPTQALLKLVFDRDMFKNAMKSFDLDVNRMPLGKLSKTQLAKGFEVLEELEKAVESTNRQKMTELSSKFYTVIPHDFGRKVPPLIDTQDIIRRKYDILLVLSDIEIAQSLEKEEEKFVAGLTKLPHPLDVKYELLKCDLKLVDPKSKEFKVLETYARETGEFNKGVWNLLWRGPKIKYIWSMRRDEEEERFKRHDKISNRKLLWHGTNIAVIAAILKRGLRIMPHSGGRVGRGIYFASEHRESASYVQRAGRTGIMFLNEVALGNEHIITKDNSKLKSAPPGFDCVIAKGWTEPDPEKDIKLKFDGKDVVVPQGTPVSQSEYVNKSRFGSSEYLIYKESQNMMRYLVMIDF
ncbi:protein mono-ADP-ribosyltransferase PARP3-like [Ostrea edulis]|uniref:protein mono-ADP-ribosyltransferase PARP3-like n=1 Tax=Ostrea edulis TaxID=37623 RepID=UPI0024AED8B7|nr:protein mono-ADP-ribosyltransferase PARP3-like [Ostrea edulis]